jgi:hypothetical protein
MPEQSAGFSWQNYLPQHRALIALRFEQAKRLHVCTICGRYPVVERKALVHEALRSIGAEACDPKPLVKALALCRPCMSRSDDELADVVWPGWRTT